MPLAPRPRPLPDATPSPHLGNILLHPQQNQQEHRRINTFERESLCGGDVRTEPVPSRGTSPMSPCLSNVPTTVLVSFSPVAPVLAFLFSLLVAARAAYTAFAILPAPLSAFSSHELMHEPRLLLYPTAIHRYQGGSISFQIYHRKVPCPN